MGLEIERIGVDFVATFRVRGTISLDKEFYEKCTRDETKLTNYIEDYALDNWDRMKVDCEVDLL